MPKIIKNNKSSRVVRSPDPSRRIIISYHLAVNPLTAASAGIGK
jgi:hypothetical protein